MALQTGKTYYIKNVSTGKYLNVHGTDTVANSRNVNVYTKENCKAQKWVVRLAGNGARVLTTINEAYSLNIYVESKNNCTMYSVAQNTQADSVVDFLTVDASQNLYKIKIMAHNRYLCVYDLASGNVFWTSTLADPYTLWQLEDADGSVTPNPNDVNISMPLSLSQTNINNPATVKSIGCALVCGVMMSAKKGYSVNNNINYFYNNYWGTDGYTWGTPNGSLNRIYSYSLDTVKSELKAGRPIAIRAVFGSGDSNQHWVVAYGYRNGGNVDEDILVINPNNSNTSSTSGVHTTLKQAMGLYTGSYTLKGMAKM